MRSQTEMRTVFTETVENVLIVVTADGCLNCAAVLVAWAGRPSEQ